MLTQSTRARQPPLPVKALEKEIMKNISAVFLSDNSGSKGTSPGYDTQDSHFGHLRHDDCIHQGFCTSSPRNTQIFRSSSLWSSPLKFSQSHLSQEVVLRILSNKVGGRFGTLILALLVMKTCPTIRSNLTSPLWPVRTKLDPARASLMCLQQRQEFHFRRHYKTKIKRKDTCLRM
jgi:hypothetical protein